MPLYIIMALVFLATASIVFFFIYLFLPKKSVLEERLEGLMPSTTETVTLLDKPPTAWQKFIAKLGANIPLRPEYQGKYMRTLVAGGIKQERLPLFMGAKLSLVILLPIAYLIFYGLPLEKDLTIRYLFVAIFAIVGFLLPSYWLTKRVKNRQLEIFHDMPDILDLLTVCVEAGLGLEAAMIKVAEDVQFKKRALTSEMKIALQEIRAGKPRLMALRDMGERAMVDDLKSFSAMLIQTERFGTSLAQALRVHADSLRTARRQMAEEAAAKISIKMLFPLVFFIFPALLVVILGPGIIRIGKFLGDM